MNRFTPRSTSNRKGGLEAGKGHAVNVLRQGFPHGVWSSYSFGK